MTAGAAKAEMVKQLRAYVKSRNPEMSFGIEWFNDVTGFHADYIHNIFDSGNPFHCPEFVRYLFPELVTTDRCIRDDRDIERRVNLAIRLGLRSDIEIYRCRALIDETPHYKEYLTRANAFRERNRALILDGRFRDTVGASCDNPKVGFAVFEAGRRCGVILTGGSTAERAEVTVPGGRFTGFDRISGGEAKALSPSRILADLPPLSLILLIFER